MTFNELNSVEHYIIHQLVVVNLNEGKSQEPQPDYRSLWTLKIPKA
ncbi:MAG: hypothetical protein ACLFUH_11225 [Bacteroidales bacterium]